MKRKAKRWNLYWVESDGYEDCFVVALNSRSACSVEINMNGFHPGEVTATRVMVVPEHAGRSYRRTEKYKERPWPWYVYGKTFFEKLGAEFRTVGGQQEMLLDEVVYEVEDFCAL